jgi:hypothetical protein
VTDTPTLSQRAAHAHEQATRARREADSRRLRHWDGVYLILRAHMRGRRFCCEPDGRCWKLARALRSTDGLTSGELR